MLLRTEKIEDRGWGGKTESLLHGARYIPSAAFGRQKVYSTRMVGLGTKRQGRSGETAPDPIGEAGLKRLPA